MNSDCTKAASNMNYARFLNQVSLARQPSPIRLLTALLARSKPSMISLAGGNPNPSLFPFKEIDIKLRDGTSLNISEERMKVALQYAPTNGIADLVSWLMKLQNKLHGMPVDGSYDICVTPGSQDGLCKSMEMLISPGDNVLIESPTYSGTLAILKPMDCNLLPIRTDEYGIIPDELKAILSKWNPRSGVDDGRQIPKILYTVPNGGNPTGASLTLERRKEIYKLAQEYDLLILEDDPYYFLQFCEPRIPSFMSLDTDGRVLRFDSFSKVMSSGLRLGFVSGPKVLVDRVTMHLMASALHASTLSQVMVNDLLQRWGLDGFDRHCVSVMEFYRQQKDLMTTSANKWLTGIAEWGEPSAGMFMWFKLKGITDTKRLIEEKAQKQEVLFVPGNAFMVDSSLPSPHIRASFSLASPEQIDKVFDTLPSNRRLPDSISDSDIAPAPCGGFRNPDRKAEPLELKSGL